MASFYEIIIKGDSKVVRAYMEGFMKSKGIEDGIDFGEDHPLDLGHLKEVLKFHGDVLHLVVEAKLRVTVDAAIEQSPEDLDMEIVESRRIHRAYFHFKFQTANRNVGKRIKRLLDRLPEGVQLTDYEPEEIVDPEAKATEGYAPVHEYQFKGKGVVEGEPGAVRDVFEKMVEDEFIDCDDIVMHFSSN